MKPHSIDMTRLLCGRGGSAHEARLARLEARMDQLEHAVDRLEATVNRFSRMMRRCMLVLTMLSLASMSLVLYLALQVRRCHSS
jgi:hypothetical protein